MRQVRRDAFSRLSTQSNPWIEHSTDLARVLDNVTSEHEIQTVYEVERLFHSCRIEPEVTKEAISTLKVRFKTYSSIHTLIY
jgi:hypothetical protein